MVQKVLGAGYIRWGLKALFLTLPASAVLQAACRQGVSKGYFQLLAVLLLSAALCYAVCRFEVLWESFSQCRKKRVLSYAVFGAVSFALLYHPLDAGKVQVRDFERVIGAGMAAGIDVSRRIHSFYLWFLVFGAAAVLFFISSDYEWYLGNVNAVCIQAGAGLQDVSMCILEGD